MKSIELVLILESIGPQNVIKNKVIVKARKLSKFSTQPMYIIDILEECFH